MLPSPRPLSSRTPLRAAAVLGTCLLATAAVTVPASAAPGAQAVGARTASGSGSAYAGFSNGTLAFVNAANVPQVDVARVGLGQSAAAVAIPTGLGTPPQDRLLQPLLVAPSAGKTAYGHSAGVYAGLVSGQSTNPQVAESLVEATSPAPQTKTGVLLNLPADPVATANVLPGTATANTTADGSCVIGKDISNGAAHVADARLLSPTATTPVVQLGNTSDSVSRTRLVAPTTTTGTVVNTGKSGLLSQTTQVLAPITLLKGTPGQITITVLGPLQLSAAAGGVPGTSVVNYAVVGKGPTDPVVTISGGGMTASLTSQQVFGNGGVVLPLGVADVTIGAPAHSLTGLEGTKVTESSDGTSASAAADFVRVTNVGLLKTPGTNPVDGPLGPVLNPVLNPVLAAVDPALKGIADALRAAGLNLADVRLGHLEASSTVPTGGIDCGSPDNPLDETYKDVSASTVPPGTTFTYDLRIPNRGTSPLTDVVVKDTYADGLEFVSSVPAPTSTGTNSLRYDLGTIAPNEFVTIVMTFRTPADAVNGHVYRNDATVTGTYLGKTVTKDVGVPGPTVAAAHSGGCNLSGSTKYASNTRVTTGERFGYFVNVLNSGDSACADVVVKDTLVEGVSFVSCTGGCTHDGSDLTWKLGTLAPGASQVLSVIVKVTATSGTLPNTAHVTSPSGPGGNPSTPGPVITSVSTGRPGAPANGPFSGGPAAPGELPHTGLPTAPAALALTLLAGTAVLVRRRRTA